jgi:transcriptional regulator with XRE-family HTH domain
MDTRIQQQAPALAAMVERIRAYRAAGGRLGALAARAGVSKRLLQQWLSGSAVDTYTATLAKVAEALDEGSARTAGAVDAAEEGRSMDH